MAEAYIYPLPPLQVATESGILVHPFCAPMPSAPKTCLEEKKKEEKSVRACVVCRDHCCGHLCQHVTIFKTAVPFGSQTTQTSSVSSPRRDSRGRGTRGHLPRIDVFFPSLPGKRAGVHPCLTTSLKVKHRYQLAWYLLRTRYVCI